MVDLAFGLLLERIERPEEFARGRVKDTCLPGRGGSRNDLPSPEKSTDPYGILPRFPLPNNLCGGLELSYEAAVTDLSNFAFAGGEKITAVVERVGRW